MYEKEGESFAKPRCIIMIERQRDSEAGEEKGLHNSRRKERWGIRKAEIVQEKKRAKEGN